MFAYQRAVRKITADPEPKRPYSRPEPKSPRVRPGRGLDNGVWFGLAAVLAVALIVSFRHMAHLAERHGETRISALLIPVSVDGLVLVAALKLLADARTGRKTGRGLPWFTLILAGTASLAANVAVAEPTTIGRMIGAWPPVAVILAWELTLRHIRNGQEERDSLTRQATRHVTRHDATADSNRTTFSGVDAGQDDTVTPPAVAPGLRAQAQLTGAQNHSQGLTGADQVDRPGLSSGAHQGFTGPEGSGLTEPQGSPVTRAQAHGSPDRLSEPLSEPQGLTETDTVAQARTRKAHQVDKVTAMLADSPGLTGPDVVEALGVSLATAKRYLAEARRGA